MTPQPRAEALAKLRTLLGERAYHAGRDAAVRDGVTGRAADATS